MLPARRHGDALTGSQTRILISRSTTSLIVWFELSLVPLGSTSSGAQTRNDKAWRNDFQTRYYDAVEMVVARNQDVSATVLGELD